MTPTAAYYPSTDVLALDFGRLGAVRLHRRLQRMRVTSTDVMTLAEWVQDNAEWVRATYRRLALQRR